MNSKSIKNFTEAATVEVNTFVSLEGKSFVVVTSDGGNMRFQHTMTVVQALEMANALLDAALALEKGCTS